MKTYKAEGSFPGSFEVRLRAPMDDRWVVDSIDGMLNPDTWKSEDGTYYHYKEMPTICQGSLYIYIGESGNTSQVADINNWVKIGEAENNLDSYITDNVVLPKFYKLKLLSQEEYNALPEIDEHTLYYIPNESHLINNPGPKGKSAYESWLEQNNYNPEEHSESEFLESLHAIAREWIGTREEFDSLSNLSPNTSYYITE